MSFSAADDRSKLAQLQRVLPNVSRETFERLLIYEQLFHKWSKAINLAAPSTLLDFWSRHIVDSAQVMNLHTPTGQWIDIGSGGGLPGAILAILLTDSGAEPIRLVESNGKKAAFLRTALNETGAKGIVLNARIEDIAGRMDRVDVVTARALAPLAILLVLTEPWISRGARGLFHKGRDFRREINEARGDWQFDLVEHASSVSSDSAILEISNLQRQTHLAQ